MWRLAANDLQQTRVQLHSEREGSAGWAAGSARRFIGAYIMEGPVSAAWVSQEIMQHLWFDGLCVLSSLRSWTCIDAGDQRLG